LWKSKLAHFYPVTPLIFAHRGASAHAPENTLPAFGLALEQGADGIELDVTLSADGVPIVIHDDTLDRTTTGRGPVAARTLAELRALDAGFPASFGDRHVGTHLPTLDEVFGAYGQQALFNVELKHDRSSGRRLAAATVSVIGAHAMQRRVLISSFQFSNLRRVRALDPNLPIGLLYVSAAFSRRLVRWLTASLRPEAHHPSTYLLTPSTVAWYHEHGLRVNTWTVNDAEAMRTLAAAGVDGLITDDPALALRTLRWSAG
jgi:glycerophosphoryl diester phosphodiesterase